MFETADNEQVHFQRLITPTGAAAESYSSQYKVGWGGDGGMVGALSQWVWNGGREGQLAVCSCSSSSPRFHCLLASTAAPATWPGWAWRTIPTPCPHPLFLSSYHFSIRFSQINDRAVSVEAYIKRLETYNILVKARNFLVFQVHSAHSVHGCRFMHERGWGVKQAGCERWRRLT